MTILSKELEASSNKIQSIILQRLARVSQVSVAIELGVREDVISKFKSDKLAFACDFIAVLGLKIVPDDSVEVSQDEIQALKTLAAKYFVADEIRRKKATN